MTWDQLGRLRLRLYSTAWCPDCHRLKRLLRLRQVAFEDIDIDTDAEAARRLREATGRAAIPYLQIEDGPFVPGWHEQAPGRFCETTFLADCDAALAAIGKP